MAKDPAFLFYPGDWQGGTSTMTRHLKGCYIDLLISQFNSGPLSLEEIKNVLGPDFSLWGSLSKKFSVNEAGKYFNARLEKERDKRKEFTQKQKKRAEDGWKKRFGTTTANATALPVENENPLLADKNKKELLTDQAFHELVCMNLSVSMPYMISKLQEFVNEKQVGGELEKPLNDCQRHFRNWLKIQIKNEAKAKPKTRDAFV